MVNWFAPVPTASCNDQLVTLVQAICQDWPLTVMVVTETGAVPESVTRLVAVVRLVEPLIVKFAATAASWLARKARRSTNHCLTGDGLPSAWPSHQAMPLARSDLYFASMTGLQFAAVSGPLTASCTARQYARTNGGKAYIVEMVGSSELNNVAVLGE